MGRWHDLFLLATEPYRNYGSFSGRARQRDYFLFIAFQWLVIVCIAILHRVLTGGARLPDPEQGLHGSLPDQLAVAATLLFILASIVPWLAVSTRRLHDRGYRGWIMVRWFLPYVGLLFMLWDLLRAGDRGPNAFGPDPRGVNFDDWFE
ncbi:DUF805 domain-containing protein [Altererythrobacter sp. H2]|uniref:DUF805 domain-containing protein n=1 Tax=Altererythrobacter sp. H2 TaxID=3108391 RepID=UPI002B4C0601|nr:DUF805 domain-containing protein [Altererythrobacter sp. H2]WRK97212.1 DUF805 domain-containing protein [Altererythrobacter sp. H2]